MVEAKIMGTKAGGKRVKVEEQARPYATFLCQETHSGVAAYCFDDQGGMAALQYFGVLR